MPRCAAIDYDTLFFADYAPSFAFAIDAIIFRFLLSIDARPPRRYCYARYAATLHYADYALIFAFRLLRRS